MFSFNDRSLPMCVFIGLAAIICVTTVGAELKQVNVLFRHGDRAPDDTINEMYPNDPYLNYDFYPIGRGQLSNQGKMREYTLGKFLRDKYRSFLMGSNIPQSVSCISSDYDRTKMSLQLVLAGLFPPSKEQTWNPRLNWQPVPAQYLRRYEDNIFLPDECPLYLAEYDRVLRSPQGRYELSKYRDLMEQLTEWSGKNISTPLDLYYMYHTLMAEHSLDLILPDWAYTVFPKGDLWNATVFAYDIANSTPLLRRLYGGPYLRLVTRSMLATVTGTQQDERKLYLYSGHESNVAAVMHALEVYYPHVPEYSSSVILELHEIDNDYYVKVQYYQGIPSRMIALQLPGCDMMCPFDKYLQLVDEVIPSNKELICDKGLNKDYANQKSNEEIDITKYNLIRTARASFESPKGEQN